jgi:hypothetical protein
MIDHLELKALGIKIEPKNLDAKVDKLGRFAATNGSFRISGPPDVTPRLLEALEERRGLARAVLAHQCKWLDTSRGKCDTCGGGQEDYRSGMCLLCQIAVQKERKDAKS